MCKLSGQTGPSSLSITLPSRRAPLNLNQLPRRRFRWTPLCKNWKYWKFLSRTHFPKSIFQWPNIWMFIMGEMDWCAEKFITWTNSQHLSKEWNIRIFLEELLDWAKNFLNLWNVGSNFSFYWRPQARFILTLFEVRFCCFHIQLHWSLLPVYVKKTNCPFIYVLVLSTTNGHFQEQELRCYGFQIQEKFSSILNLIHVLSMLA